MKQEISSIIPVCVFELQMVCSARNTLSYLSDTHYPPYGIAVKQEKYSFVLLAKKRQGVKALAPQHEKQAVFWTTLTFNSNFTVCRNYL